VSVVLSIEDVGPCRKRLKVEVPAPAVEAESKRVVEEYRKHAKLPGFRKGKVPTELVKQKFHKEIEQDVVERLLPRYWKQAEAESELDPLLPPSVDEVDFRPGEALTFLASVEVRPEIEIGSLEEFELPELETEPTEEEIEQALEDMRRAVAEWVAADRPAASGDLVAGKLIQLDPETGDPGAEKPFSFEVGDPQIWEELTLEVTGKQAGQQAEFVRQEGEGEDSVSRRFRVVVEAVRERDLPDLDDALAARFGEYADVAALRQGVRGELKRGKESERRQERERAMLDQLLARHPLALPQGVVDSEIEGMLKEYAQSLAGQGVDLEKAELDWQGMAEQIRPQAERRVHARLVLDAVTSQQEIEVGEEDFEAALTAIGRAQGRSAVNVRQALDRSGNLVGLRAQLAREKAIKRLLGEETAEQAVESQAAHTESENDS
jgi:trigger factor